MPVDHTTAQRALDLALKTFQTDLPGSLITIAQKRGATNIFEILDATQYQRWFDYYWNSFFKLHHVGPPITTCPAFVTPSDDPAQRMIYIKNDGVTQAHTLFHETIHYLQHPNFYPNFYEVGGQNPFVLEGVTEFFTREMDLALRQERQISGKYQKNFLTVDSWSGGATSRRAELVAYCFQGVKVDLTSLGAVMPAAKAKAKGKTESCTIL